MDNQGFHVLNENGDQAASLDHFVSLLADEWNSAWLRHTNRLDDLWQPCAHDELPPHFTCGVLAFAAIARMKVDRVESFFPQIQSRPWINRTTMEKALRAAGKEFRKGEPTWPAYGLCLVHFTGPWTKRGFPLAILSHTHWIAVDREYVYDINWNGWLPKHNWEDVVLQQLISNRPRATGWQILSTYEVTEHLTPIETQVWMKFAN
jgi:hypothetical protein